MTGGEDDRGHAADTREASMSGKHRKKAYGTRRTRRKSPLKGKGRDHIEVVFFPYKASMADSFKTIYLAAKADPACNAAWCPIPYFDKNPEGTYSKVHYEGDSYPDKFEVTRYWEYDVEKRHPDIIFIHNPYDNQNLVTSVHPDYYSSRLKAFTDLLVYVDYGVPIWVNKDASMVTGFREEQILPVHLNADLILGYSEQFVDYIRHLFAFSRQFPNIKKADDAKSIAVALGSSKFDCILKNKKEDFSLPAEWKERIGKKKVFLLNTSLAELLENNEEHLKEIRHIAETVEEREDIILWWRPHPLMESTIRSMRPELQSEYDLIFSQVAETGIVDTTDDLYRAVAYSDALWSSESSMVYLYLATGKPFTMASRKKRHPQFQADEGTTFDAPLQSRLAHMKAHPGANPGNWNGCVWWDNFQPEDFIGRIRYEHFLERFIHYIVHRDAYPDAAEYERLSIKMFRDFVTNPDGTAGEHIYHYCKERVMG